MRKTYLALVIPALLTSANSLAQEPASIELGGFDLVPSLKYKLAHDNNITRSDTDEISSWISTISPEAVLLNNFGANRVQVGYRLERANYFSSQRDNYTDHFLNAQLDYEFDMTGYLNNICLTTWLIDILP